MIPYFGLPITPASVATKVIHGAHAFVSFAHPDQLEIAVSYSQGFAVDNGAFSFFRSGTPVDWDAYAEWVSKVSRFPNFDFAIIPDSIDGGEVENDALLARYPLNGCGVPVWHLNESIDRLVKLGERGRVAIGGSAKMFSPGSRSWWEKMSQVMDAVCDPDGFPRFKIHGLMMLSPDVIERIPLSSADSTNIGRNVGIDSAWTGRNTPATKESRGLVLRHRVEACLCARRWDRGLVQSIIPGMLI